MVKGYPGFAPSYGYQFPGEWLCLRALGTRRWTAWWGVGVGGEVVLG